MISRKVLDKSATQDKSATLQACSAHKQNHRLPLGKTRDPGNEVEQNCWVAFLGSCDYCLQFDEATW